ncbi:MAG: response regulator [bacterium]
MFKKVLVIEDSHILFEMYKAVFSCYPGCQVFFASNGLDAMDMLTFQEDIDLIISEIYMRKMDGLNFLKTMYQEGYSHIPVIVSSFEKNESMFQKAIDLGAKAYIKKPWHPQQVLDLIGIL